MRADLVRAVASVIAERIQYDADLAPLTWGEVVALNRLGWTVETTAPLGHVVRWDGVRLRTGDLWLAWRLAQRWVGDAARPAAERGSRGVAERSEAE